jgi:hypothetical protein
MSHPSPNWAFLEEVLINDSRGRQCDSQRMVPPAGVEGSPSPGAQVSSSLAKKTKAQKTTENKKRKARMRIQSQENLAEKRQHPNHTAKRPQYTTQLGKLGYESNTEE